MKNTLKITIAGILANFCAVGIANASIFGKPSEKEITKEKVSINQTSDKILNKLYKIQPNAKAQIKNSYGYATFSDFGMKIFIAGGGTGKGVVVPKNGDKVYMDMAEIQAGLGIGIKQFEVVFIFETKEALDSFVNSGWSFGGQATAAAKYEQNGGAYQGAVNVGDGLWMYQMTKNGLAAEITLKGTKYYKDSNLN